MIRKKRRAYQDPRGTGGIVGERYKNTILKMKERMLKTDDNVVVVCAGQTGSGKTSLGFATGEVYQEGTPLQTDQVAMDKQTFVEMLLEQSASKGKFLMYDEGSDVNRRSSMTAWNRDFIDALMTLRGKNWFMWINLPDANYLDRMLLDSDLVNFFVFVHRKQKRFLVFNRRQMQNMLREHDNMKPDTIQMHGKEHAALDSWWLKYTHGPWDAYLKVKEESMNNRIQYLNDKYGRNRTLSTREAADKLGVSQRTVQTYLSDNAESEAFSDARNAVGNWRLTEDHIEHLRGLMGGST